MTNQNGTYESRCAVCGERLTEPIFATSHFIEDESHYLYRFSDAPMHWSCYVAWPHQARFATMYFRASLERAGTNPYWAVLFRSADVLVTYGLAVNEISVELRKSGTQFRVSRDEWRNWLDGGWREGCRPELEADALAEVIPGLARLALPQQIAATDGSETPSVENSPAPDWQPSAS